MNISQLWDQLVDCICRPPRDVYGVEDLIGGYAGRYSIGSYRGFREDLELVNGQGQKLQCSHFKPQIMAEQEGPFPCVVYCHCNSGSRRDAEEAVILLIPQNVSVFCLDFSGSGLSEGDWVTLGAHEVDDLEIAIKHLRSDTQISTIALWGRSMGAVTALLYSRRDPTIAGMVLDSPFSKLNDLMLELVQEQQVPIPRALVRLALMAMRRSVRRRAGFDIYTISPIDTVHESFVPVLFGHADEDSFIKKTHSERLLERYAGDKNLITFTGDHNSRRTQFFYSSVTIFYHNTLKIQGELAEAQPDLPVVNGPHHEVGTTNVPWTELHWADAPNLLDSVDALLAEEVANGGSNSDDLDKEDLSDDELHSLAKLREQNGSEFAWYRMAPSSRIEEETMLQEALKASYEDVKGNTEAGPSSIGSTEQTPSSKVEQCLSADPSFEEQDDENAVPVDTVKLTNGLVVETKDEAAVAGSSLQSEEDPATDPPSKQEDTD